MNYQTGCLYLGFRILRQIREQRVQNDESYCRLGFETDFCTTVHLIHFLDNSELIVSLATERASSQWLGS